MIEPADTIATALAVLSAELLIPKPWYTWIVLVLSWS